MSERDYSLYLQDILEAVAAIESYLAGADRQGLVDDRKTWSATIRELEIIGEAAGKIPEEVRARHTGTNWRLLKDFRNVLAHQYFGISADIVWDIVQNKLPVLKGQMERITAEEKSRNG